VIEPVPVPSSDARTWAMLSHLAALAVFTSVPFGNVLGPLIVYLIKKDEDPFIAEQGKESINFQITVTIVGILLGLGYIAGFFAVILESRNTMLPWPLVFIPCFFALAVFDVVSVAFAAMRSYHGEHFRYPVSFRFLR
jgi:uncharacterized Tic20 family protein